MITLRKYLLLSLLVVPAFMNAAPADDNGDINAWLGTNARWHYTKQACYGMAEGAVMALSSAVAARNGYTLTSEMQALIAVVISGGASQYIRSNSEMNKDGAQNAQPGLAWASNLAGYVTLGGTLAYCLLQNAKK